MIVEDDCEFDHSNNMLWFKYSKNDKNDYLFKYKLIWIFFVFNNNDLMRLGVKFESTINHKRICFKVWESKNSRILLRMMFSSKISV